jgi:hypothetical protein
MSRKRMASERELDGEEDATFKLVGTVFEDAVVEGKEGKKPLWQQEVGKHPAGLPFLRGGRR